MACVCSGLRSLTFSKMIGLRRDTNPQSLMRKKRLIWMMLKLFSAIQTKLYNFWFFHTLFPDQSVQCNILSFIFFLQKYEVTEKKEVKQPVTMNAFELISMSRGLNLGNLFDSEQV